MATYLSNLYASGLQTITGSGGNAVIRAVFSVTLPAGTVTATSDIIKLAPIPYQNKITGFYLDIPGLDQSAGIVSRLGDYGHSNGIYANGLTLGRTSTAGFVQQGGTGAVSGVIGSQTAVYTTKNSQRTNKDSADDFLLTLSTGPSLAATSTARIIYGWLDFEADTSADTQGS